jgi:hypothetical protein
MLVQSDEKNKITKANQPRILRFFGFFCVFTFAIAAVFALTAKTASPPSYVTYQGKLLVGGTSATTSQNMYFILYDAPTGGTALYTAAGTPGSPSSISITPVAGLFTVILGDTGTNALDPIIFKNYSDIYLEVRIGAETLTPRKQITASPYAFNAKYLDGFGVSQTATDTAYIPVADASGNFDLNGVTTTNVYSSGNMTASNSVRSDQYCDVNGANCFTPSSALAGGVTQLVKTAASFTGSFTSGALIGYQAANDICNTELSGSHFCRTDEVIYLIQTQDVSYFSGTAWIAEGPPGYTANSNDCNGWTIANAAMLGAFWELLPNGGGMGWLVNCSVSKSIACCK